MGTNLAPILANLYRAMLQQELKRKCKHDAKLKLPTLFLRFMDDGFGIMESTKKDIEYWICQFNNLRETKKIDKWSFGNHVEYMDLYIYKGDKFYSHGFLDLRIFQKENFDFNEHATDQRISIPKKGRQNKQKEN